MADIVNSIIITLIAFGANNLIPIMIFVFLIGMIFKFLMYKLLRAEANFSSAFETRVHRYLNREYQKSEKISKFHELVDFILNKTFHESYTLRKKHLRKRKEDSKAAMMDSIFFVEYGAKALIDDTLKQTQYHDNGKAPDFKNVVKYIFNSNPYFNKLWGIIPLGLSNNIFSRLPSLFIIGGIFGTFLGISNGLPALKSIDPGNFVAAQATIGNFLGSMTFAMYSSVVGIFLSVCFTVMNAFMSLNTMYLNLVDRFTGSLELLWKETNAG